MKLDVEPQTFLGGQTEAAARQVPMTFEPSCPLGVTGTSNPECQHSPGRGASCGPWDILFCGLMVKSQASRGPASGRDLHKPLSGILCPCRWDRMAEMAGGVIPQGLVRVWLTSSLRAGLVKVYFRRVFSPFLCRKDEGFYLWYRSSSRREVSQYWGALPGSPNP